MYRDVDRLPYLFTLRDCARAYDLDLELIRSGPEFPGWADRLEKGDIDLLGENYWGLQSFRAKGVPFVTVASVVNKFTEMLVANDAVQSVDDLRGKKLAVRAGGPQLFLPGLWLKDNGLAQDVEQVLVPDRDVGRWGHWKKVADGTTQATFMAYLYADIALAAGLHEVPIGPYFFEGMNVTLTFTERTIADRHDDVQKLVNATFDATNAFKTDAPRILKTMNGEALEPLREHFDLPDEKSVTRLYEILRDELADVPVPHPAGILNALRVVRGESAARPQREEAHYEDEVVPETFNPMLMWDLSFAREAMRARGN
jgi:hypothetical protein